MQARIVVGALDLLAPRLDINFFVVGLIPYDTMIRAPEMWKTIISWDEAISDNMNLQNQENKCKN